MEEHSSNERQFRVHWYIHVTRAGGGVIRCRAITTGTTSLLFLSPIRYRYGDIIDMVIYLNPQQTISCKGRITNSKSPYRVEFQRFYSEDRLIYNDLLLQMLREARKKNELAEIYSPSASGALRRSP